MSEFARPLIAITMGDPAGVGPEVVVRALANPDLHELATLLVLGDQGVLKKATREIGASVEFTRVSRPSEAEPGRANLMSLSSVNMDDFQFGKPNVDLGLISTFYIVKAADLAMARQVDAIVTCPVNKAMLGKAGYDYTSHSEMLEAYTGGKNATVMMVGEHLRITRVTGHAAIRQVADLITHDRVLSAIRLTHETLMHDFGLENPHLAVCGLNPHAGEGGLFGLEDREIIIPAIEAARQEGILVSGPLPADTLYIRARDGLYDAVLCMYHDQGHIAFRLIEFGAGYNITLGLPIVRTAPDHGTAYDIAGKGYASEKSLLKSIRAAAEIANRRRSAL